MIDKLRVDELQQRIADLSDKFSESLISRKMGKIFDSVEDISAALNDLPELDELEDELDDINADLTEILESEKNEQKAYRLIQTVERVFVVHAPSFEEAISKANANTEVQEYTRWTAVYE